MKNLAHIDVEKLEKLPKKYKRLRDWDYYDRRPGNFPWRHFNRFLQTRVGDNWDKVVSDLVKVDWIPVEHRNYHKFAEHVETHTLIQNGKVCYFDRWYVVAGNDGDVRGNIKPIESSYGERFYVHPVKKTLEMFIPKGRKKQRDERRAAQPKEFVSLEDYRYVEKIDGIWYEVWLDQDPRKTEWGQYNYIKPDAHFTRFNCRDYQLKIGTQEKIASWLPGNQIYRNAIYRTIPGPKFNILQLNSKELKRLGLKNDPKPIKYGRLK